MDAFTPLLRTPGGRVVFQSSAAGPNYVAKAPADAQKLLTDKSVTVPALDAYAAQTLPTLSDASDEEKMAVYGLSKALLNGYNMAFAREHPDLVVNACTPGGAQAVSHSSLAHILKHFFLFFYFQF